MQDDFRLTVSTDIADAGQKVGVRPTFQQAEALRALGYPTSWPKAVRAKCLDCCCGMPSEVLKCVLVDCPLWPFRMGKNPFHGAAGRKPKMKSEGSHDRLED